MTELREPVHALTATRVEKTFGATGALRSLSLSIDRGEIYGLVGPDGAGKTTAMRIFAGLMRPTTGEVRVLGADPASTAEEVRSSLGYMPQQYSLYGDLSVAENLAFFSKLYCLPRPVFRERRDRLLEITRLGPFTARRADALSGGMYKKLALACALLSRPSVLLLDEPTNGVDPVSRRELWVLLFELASQGMAVLISTAYLDEAERCHRVGLLDKGALLLEGPPNELLATFKASQPPRGATALTFADLFASAIEAQS
ncbi:MAG: ABC transporter ATP-binding protein [Deltaproteobacteria bacterium]|nr:ABC transporter ATP-binding protein [Deltaproteobacteria bacterium]